MSKSLSLATISATVFVITWPVALSAGEVSVQGRVVTDQGVPVPGYPVIIEGDSGQQVTITDQAGNFTTRGLTVGQYEAVPANRLGEPVPFIVDDQALELGGSSQESLGIGDITIPNQWQMQ
jgi:hypothetical protein